MFSPLKFLMSLWGIITGFFLDKHLFLDEKKVLGAAYLIGALLLPFALPVDPAVLTIILGLGVALYLGVPIGETVPPLQSLPGLGLFDLITNKANAGDPYRFFGLIFLLTALFYVFSPLWLPWVTVRWEQFGLLGLTGLALFGVAIFGDHVATGTASQ